MSAERDQNAKSRAQLQQQTDQLLAQYGDPNYAGMDPQTAALAKANYASGNSVLAQLDHAHHQNRTAVVNQLASHGILGSGELGYGLTQQDKAYGHDVYGAQQNLLQQIQQLQSGELSSEQSAHSQVLSALQGAWQNYNANPGMYAQLPQTVGFHSPAHHSSYYNPYTTGRKKYG